MSKSLCLHFLSLVAAVAAIQVAMADEVRVGNRDELVRALHEAKAGTTILIASGTYRGGFSHAGLQGTKDQPIVIAAADPSNPPAIDAQRIGLHLSSPVHVELRDLVILEASGNGINIDDSGSVKTPAHDLVLRNIVVRGTSPRGNRDGIKLSGIDSFRIEGCHVERWGSSGSAIDMVGCHHGTVRGCKFVNAGGDAANGVQTKGGSSHIVIQHCRFENAGGRAVNVGGSTGLPYFRPSDAGFEAKNITVEDCEILGGMAAIAFVGVDGALARHNTIYRPRRWPVRILQENTDPRFVACRNGRFVDNVVAFRSDEVRETINVGGQTEPATFEFSGNLWHCLDRPQDTQRLVRTPVKETKSSYGPDPGFKDAENGDVAIPNRQPEDPGARPGQSPQPK
jgi:hypothetical protein